MEGTSARTSDKVPPIIIQETPGKQGILDPGNTWNEDLRARKILKGNWKWVSLECGVMAPDLWVLENGGGKGGKELPSQMRHSRRLLEGIIP
jgi:hypothetical protein